MNQKPITTYNEFWNYQEIDKANSLFWIVEYMDSSLPPYQKYNLLRNEMLLHPSDFRERLDSGVYRIWTSIPPTQTIVAEEE